MTEKPIWIAGAGALMTLVPGWARAQEAPAPDWPGWYDCGGHMMGWGAGGFGPFFGPIFMILVLALVIAVAVLLVRWLAGAGPGAAPHHPVPPPIRTPLDILKERFARGEIDKDEFEERRRSLGE